MLKVPLKNQKEGSRQCLIACVQMIMEYRKDNISYAELTDLLSKHVNEKEVHAQGAAIFLPKKNYNVIFAHHDPNVIDKETDSSTEKELEKLKRRHEVLVKDNPDSFRTKKLGLDIEYIEAGGKYSNKIPSLKLIDSNLDKEIPVIACISQKVWRSEPENKSNHYVVVIGRENEDYIINDPLPEFKEPYRVGRDRLLMAWYACGAYTLVAK